jgi:hypothetical protein
MSIFRKKGQRKVVKLAGKKFTYKTSGGIEFLSEVLTEDYMKVKGRKN